MENIRSIRGMVDLVPPEGEQWVALQRQFSEILHRYSYDYCATPIVERTQLFHHSIGGSSDIVGKEMYSFTDRGGEAISLRPEGTVSALRSIMQHNLLQQNSLQRLWYLGPFFRYERPQKGRLRQFHQLGVEAYGSSCSSIDAEIIAISFALLRHFNLLPHSKLLLNSLGTIATRQLYRQKLVDYFSQYKNDLDQDSLRQLATNPLRILDSKVTETQQIVAEAPLLLQFLTDSERQHFDSLCQHLTDLKINYSLEPKLVRGLDYYSHTVFEWQSDLLGAQSAILGGGRYDGLAQSLGHKNAVPACGFAMGVERLLLVLEQLQSTVLTSKKNNTVFMCYQNDTKSAAFLLAEQLRQHCPKLQVIWHTSSTNMVKQFAKANKLDCHFSVILGETELKSHSITLKDLKQNKQQSLSRDDCITFFNSL